MGVAAAVAHPAEELLHLLQRQRVVQRLQWVDGRDHGAALEACGTQTGTASGNWTGATAARNNANHANRM